MTQQDNAVKPGTPLLTPEQIETMEGWAIVAASDPGRAAMVYAVCQQARLAISLEARCEKADGGDVWDRQELNEILAPLHSQIAALLASKQALEGEYKDVLEQVQGTLQTVIVDSESYQWQLGQMGAENAALSAKVQALELALAKTKCNCTAQQLLTGLRHITICPGGMAEAALKSSAHLDSLPPSSGDAL